MKKFVISLMMVFMSAVAIASPAIATSFYDSIADTVQKEKVQEEKETVLAGPWKQLEEILRQFSYANQAFILRVGCTLQQLNVEDNFWTYENKIVAQINPWGKMQRIHFCQGLATQTQNHSFDCVTCSGTLSLSGRTFEVRGGTISAFRYEQGGIKILTTPVMIRVATESGYSITFRNNLGSRSIEKVMTVINVSQTLEDILKDQKDLRYDVIEFSMPVSVQQELINAEHRATISTVYQIIDQLYQQSQTVTPIEFAKQLLLNPSFLTDYIQKYLQ